MLISQWYSAVITHLECYKQLNDVPVCKTAMQSDLTDQLNLVKLPKGVEVVHFDRHDLMGHNILGLH